MDLGPGQAICVVVGLGSAEFSSLVAENRLIYVQVPQAKDVETDLPNCGEGGLLRERASSLGKAPGSSIWRTTWPMSWS